MATYTIAAAVQVELEIRKSRFIGVVLPVADRAEAAAHIQRMRQQYPDATHVCWALLAGGQSGMSDDGEPSGTAGRPMLEVLRHHDVEGVLGMVVRYYGGIKLGAGGLVRAYTDAIASAMKLAERVELVKRGQLELEVEYADEARIRRWLEQKSYSLIDTEHAATVRLRVELPEAELAQAEAELRDLTQGRAMIRSVE